MMIIVSSSSGDSFLLSRVQTVFDSKELGIPDLRLPFVFLVDVCIFIRYKSAVGNSTWTGTGSIWSNFNRCAVYCGDESNTLPALRHKEPGSIPPSHVKRVWAHPHPPAHQLTSIPQLGSPILVLHNYPIIWSC